MSKNEDLSKEKPLESSPAFGDLHCKEQPFVMKKSHLLRLIYEHSIYEFQQRGLVATIRTV